MFDAYLFDLDGTLIHSIPSIICSQRYALQTVVGGDLPDECLMSGIGTPLKLQLRDHAARIRGCKAEDIDDALADRLCETYLAHNLQSHLSGEIQPYAGIRELFAWLHENAVANGTKVGLVTSKARKTVLIDLEKTGLEAFFAAVICGEDSVRHKPAPDPVWVALEKLSVQAENAIYVGDALCDMASGRAAGVKTGAAAWGPFGERVLTAASPDYMLHSPLDLRNL